MFWLKILSACDRTSLWFLAQQVKYVSHRSKKKGFKKKSLPGKLTTLLLPETAWVEFVFWRCKFLKPVQKLATQKIKQKNVRASMSHCINFSCKIVSRKIVVAINKGRYIRDLTIRQRRRPWKRRWKVDFPSLHSFLRLFQGAQLLKRREFQ